MAADFRPGLAGSASTAPTTPMSSKRFFDEGVILWADLMAGAGAGFLPVGAPQLEVLLAQGYRRA